MSAAKEKDILHQLQQAARTIRDPADRQTKILEDAQVDKLSTRSGLTRREIHVRALKAGIWPYRYIRNRSGMSREEQIKLAEARVAVIGAGGLGGTLIALLARCGIGFLTIVDCDVFDETNLNRQLISDTTNLGRSKAKEAAHMVARINPAVIAAWHHLRIEPGNAADLLADHHVLVDALDNIRDRFVLEGVARSVGIPLVHGALAGFNGQVMTIFPEDPGLRLLYGTTHPAARDPGRAEAVLGVPAPTPSAVATAQAMEVVKIILNRGGLFRNRMLHIDLEAGRYEVFNF